MESESHSTTEAALAPLAAQINSGHQKCLKAVRASLQHAREAGTLLLEVREKLEAVGQPWRAWVQDHCQCSLGEAGRYMRIADRYAELRKSGEDLSRLTVTQALQLLAGGQRKASGESFRPLKVGSRAEVKQLAREAAAVRLPDGSAEQKFLAATVAGVARQILARAGRSKLADGDGQPLSAAAVAVVLLEQLKQALTVETVVEVEEGEQAAQPHAPASSPKPAQPHAARPRPNGARRRHRAAAATG
jgi:hypothetical protein